MAGGGTFIYDWLKKKILNDTKSPKKNDIQVFYSNLLLGGDFKFKN